MITFSHLDKTEKYIWLPKLFDLLYDNMKVIVPSGLPYEQEKNSWLSNVSPAIDRAPRQIIMCFDDGALAGFMQYYIRNDLLMIEEVQLAGAYQRTTAFYRMCKYLKDKLPDGIKHIEAYADKRNLNSISIMKKLGMEIIENDDDSPYLHLRGDTEQINRHFHRN